MEDHPLMRQGLCSTLAGERGIEVVGEAADGPAALAAAAELAPDVVLMDISLPKLDGVEVTRRLRELSPGLTVIALTVHDEPYHMRQMIEAGASTYLLKTEVGPNELVKAIRQASLGRADLPSSVKEAMADGAVLALLSKREREVLKLVAAGLANKEIAAELGVAVRTVETFRLRLQQKLKLSGTAALTRFAIEHGLVRKP